MPPLSWASYVCCIDEVCQSWLSHVLCPSKTLLDVYTRVTISDRENTRQVSSKARVTASHGQSLRAHSRGARSGMLVSDDSVGNESDVAAKTKPRKKIAKVRRPPVHQPPSSVLSSSPEIPLRLLDLRAEEDPVKQAFWEACHRSLDYFASLAAIPRTGFSLNFNNHSGFNKKLKPCCSNRFC